MYVRVCVCVRAICASVPERNPLGAPSQKGGGESRCESVATLLRDPYSIAQLLTVLGMHVLNIDIGTGPAGFQNKQRRVKYIAGHIPL